MRLYCLHDKKNPKPFITNKTRSLWQQKQICFFFILAIGLKENEVIPAVVIALMCAPDGTNITEQHRLTPPHLSLQFTER